MVLVGDSVPPMDIDEFYEADPRRRASAELELGSEWLGKDGVIRSRPSQTGNRNRKAAYLAAFSASGERMLC